MDSARWDRHGVPRCPIAVGPGDTKVLGQGLYFGRGEPRLRFRRQLRITPECERQHSIACSEEWRMLIPLSRLSERYHALKKAGKNAEHVYRHWRDRYKVFGNNVDTRPKRPGIAWQNLRASVALLIEWFRLCARYGWLGSPRRCEEYQVEELHAGHALYKVLRSRAWHCLDLPVRARRIQARARARPGPSARAARETFADLTAACARHSPENHPATRPRSLAGAFAFAAAALRRRGRRNQRDLTL